ncbi:hypothetical protein JTE90_003529 [Oedothorax gibbosus]|uniref:Uncharacterized protein n=1 Tax=Oedothorax gibbosus TaxID=931172 RepID=A0AAV6URQ2_9ARAC|nr:hypothetical protein JTE90_003529 [Oedothorax gibbosus]
MTATGMGPYSPSVYPKIEYGTVTSYSEGTSVVPSIGDMKKDCLEKELQVRLSGPVHKPEDIHISGANTRETLWINQAWRPPGEKNGIHDVKILNNINPGMEHNYISTNASDYAEVDTHNMTTFYKKELHAPCIPAPYATTTLINPSARQHSGSVHDKSSGSEMSKKSDKMYDMEARLIEDCVTEQLLEARNVMSPSSDSGSYTTDEYGLPIRRKRLRPVQKGSVLNWMEFIPPPPDHPPSGKASPNPLRSNPYAHRNMHLQMSNENNNPTHSPQVSSRSLQSGRQHPIWSNSPQGGSLTRSPPELGGNVAPYGSSPGVDRGVQSSLLSLASDPLSAKRRAGSLKNNNRGMIYHPLHAEPHDRVRYDNVMQMLQQQQQTTQLHPQQHSPTSSLNDEGEYAPGQCPAPSWTDVTDRSSTSSPRSSVASSSDGSVYTDSDFEKVVAKVNYQHLYRTPNHNKKIDTTNTSLLSPIHNC